MQKHYKFWWSWMYGNAEKKKNITGRSLYLALLSMHWKTSYHDWIFMCNLRIKISNPCMLCSAILTFRANLLQRIEFSVNFAWPWVVVTASPTKLGTLESGRVSCNEFQIDLCLSDSCNSEQKRAARLFHRASPVAISLEPTREDGRGNSLRESWSPFYCKSTNCTMFPFAIMKFFPCNSLENEIVSSSNVWVIHSR